jgi:hypothetical protein
MKRLNILAVASVLFAFTVMCGGVAGALPVITNGLVAHYAFENNLTDSVGGSTGIGFGAISYEAGVDGQALNLDNGPTNDVFYVNEYAQLQTLTLGSEFTVSHWVRLDSNAYAHSGASFSAGRQDTAPGWLRVGVTTGLEVDVSLSQPPSSSGGVGSVDIGDGEFHHVAATVQGSQISLFVDGSLVGTDSTSGPFSLGNVETFVGFHQWEVSYGQFSSSRFDGAIDDLRIYDRALSPTEVSTLYSAIPEPTTALLLGMGLASLAVRREKR